MAYFRKASLVMNDLPITIIEWQRLVAACRVVAHEFSVQMWDERKLSYAWNNESDEVRLATTIAKFIVKTHPLEMLGD